MKMYSPFKPRMLFGKYYKNYLDFMQDKWVYSLGFVWYAFAGEVVYVPAY